MRTFSLPISGMTCGGCVAAATKALQGVAGVQRVQVSLEESAALITADDRTSDTSLDAALIKAGFKPGPRTAQA
ncbi:MAG TPA: heavy-metal-associated domain-containing protein [Planctomycetota bacterium]|jgi:copper chaperone CopZ|nr:heavy-metal-associated domain-containing protein [Planctomycetota bacterium]